MAISVDLLDEVIEHIHDSEGRICGEWHDGQWPDCDPVVLANGQVIEMHFEARAILADLRSLRMA